MDRLGNNLKQVYEEAVENAITRENRHFDLKVKVQDLQPGEPVLLRNLGVPGKHKLADRWRPQP